MKITKRDDRWYDENDNSWSTEESATQFSPTLTNCISCRECRWCYNCRDCNYCSYCRDCSNCSSCNNCSRCINCSSCSYCVDCNDCRDCISCRYCRDCSYCESIYDLSNKISFAAQFKDRQEPTIRVEIDINDRKLEPDL